MASTPLDPEVLAVMQESLPIFGNPAAEQHVYGKKSAELIEYARQQVAESIGAHAHEIIWTSGATESINLALKGAALFYQRKGKHLLTLGTEHKAVLNTCAALESQGFSTTYLKTDHHGLLNLEEFTAALRPTTVLVSVAWVNNETGVIQNIREMIKIAHRNGTLVHIDAAQALGKIPIQVKELSIDLLSLSAHKAYGPKGIGALYVQSEPRIRIFPQIHGGEQERGLRSGTLPTHQIVGMGKACQLTKAQLEKDHQHVLHLSQHFLERLKTVAGIRLNGDYKQRVPHCLNISIDGINSKILMASLPELALSSGSACHAVYSHPSHVLTAMGITSDRALSAIRISLGRFSTKAEIDETLRLIAGTLQKVIPC